jgi:isopenicillin-N N-acyltransferase-like protein
LCIVLLAIALLATGLSWFVNWYCLAQPPTVSGSFPILNAPLVRDGDRLCLGESWLARKEGIIRMYLTGDPFSLGCANARLTQKYMQQQEADLLATIHSFVPSEIKLWLLKKYVFWLNRGLSAYVPREYQLEVFGLSLGYRDPFPEIAPVYHRLLNYHAAHDISHEVMDNPLVGCTSFAAWGPMTANGHLIVGRNLDFSPGKLFDVNKIVMHLKPRQGLGFISVAWGGMSGAVSGINEARIAVTINAAQSSHKRRIGTPVSLVMRRVLQYAETLEEAIEIIKNSQVFVSDCYLVACGKTSTAVIVEKTPGSCAVRRADAEYIISANHFLSGELKNDPGNLRYMATGTTVDRYRRMTELVQQSRGKLTPEMAAAILRDRQVPGTANPGYGNQAAINSLIATHSVIIDVTAGIIWVSQYPHQEGAYVPFGLDEFESPAGAKIIPPDPMLANGAFERYLTSQERLSQAEALLKANRLADAWPRAQEARDLNPNFYQPWFVLGKIARGQGKFLEARQDLAEAQRHYPAYAGERQEIQDMLADITSKLDKP